MEIEVFLAKVRERGKPQLLNELLNTFCGGWVGYFSYDTVRYVEKKKLLFIDAPKDDRNLADIHLGLYEDVIVFDHVQKYSSTEEAYKDGIKRLEILASKVHDCDLIASERHILAGDNYQIVLSQRFERRTFTDPFEIYHALRVVNPSPYMTYLQVTGELLDNLTCWDALSAALPVGTVSGAPKGKAMELIDKLEVTRRGPYSGGFGWISFSREMDIALSLRTMVFLTGARFDTMYLYKDDTKRKQWVAYLQVGAGGFELCSHPVFVTLPQRTGFPLVTIDVS
ncbi:putative anthranilate synthase [Helianthus anomalus]